MIEILLFMKKYIGFFCLLITMFSFAQRMNYEQVKVSEDSEEIERFIKRNPKHYKVGYLKYRLAKIRRMEDKEYKKEVTKKTISVKDFREGIAHQRENYDDPNSKFKFEREEKMIADSKAGKKKNVQNNQSNTTELLNHLLGSSKHSKKAYLKVQNASKCPIVFNIKGRKNYTLKISSKKEGHILIMKGMYTLSSTICNAVFKKRKKITSDMTMKLSN